MDRAALVRRRAIVQFFKPYKSITISVMAKEFHADPEKFEEELFYLIRSGELNARINAHTQILEAKVVDCRADAFDALVKGNSTWSLEKIVSLLMWAYLIHNEKS